MNTITLIKEGVELRINFTYDKATSYEPEYLYVDDILVKDVGIMALLSIGMVDEIISDILGMRGLYDD
jgi:hypothetical protein